MTTEQFLRKYNALPEQIPAAACLQTLMQELRLGLAGQGKLPMLPSYLSTGICVPSGAQCCVLDAGGTNLRTALAVFSQDGTCRLEHLEQTSMPGTEGLLSFEDFYQALAAPLHRLGHHSRIGFCFSYNVTLERSLDGTLDYWCKEVQVPEAVGRPVGASLKATLGSGCDSVHVLNDSVAAMLGAGSSEKPVQVGIILGTGINVCYLEQCSNIPKIPHVLRSDTMIISTEVGEFDKLPKSSFEQALIAETDVPDNAQGEKQCAGGYLGDIICLAWNTAVKEGLLSSAFRAKKWDLADISRYLDGQTVTGMPQDSVAEDIARQMIRRAAKIAAILCAGPILMVQPTAQPLQIAVEGSQYWKLTGFRNAFHLELDALLKPQGVAYEIVRSENACLIGAARAAFALPM